MKIAHLVFHPNFDKSRINSAVVACVKESGKDHIDTRLMQTALVNGHFDVEKEQAYLLSRDRIVCEFPFYWYNCPALMKQYLDEVFTYGFAFGFENGKSLSQLQGKTLMLVVTTGGPFAAYQAGAFNNFTLSEYLRPFQQIANLSGMHYARPVIFYGAAAASSDAKIAAFAKEVCDRLDDPEAANPFALAKSVEGNPESGS